MNPARLCTRRERGFSLVHEFLFGHFGLRLCSFPRVLNSLEDGDVDIDANRALPIEEVGIIARGAMIPVVGSITEVQALRVSEARFTSE